MCSPQEIPFFYKLDVASSLTGLCMVPVLLAGRTTRLMGLPAPSAA